MKRLFKFTFGAFLGAFLGGTLMLLFAPESGEFTREAIQERFKSLSGQIQDAVRSRQEELQKEFEKYKS